MFQALGAPDALRRQIAERLVDVYPENVTPLRVFAAMGTQWRTGIGGATGLDYSALPAVLDMFRVRKPKQRAKVFAALRIMEGEALRCWHEQR